MQMGLPTWKGGGVRILVRGSAVWCVNTGGSDGMGPGRKEPRMPTKGSTMHASGLACLPDCSLTPGIGLHIDAMVMVEGV